MSQHDGNRSYLKIKLIIHWWSYHYDFPMFIFTTQLTIQNLRDISAATSNIYIYIYIYTEGEREKGRERGREREGERERKREEGRREKGRDREEEREGDASIFVS